MIFHIVSNNSNLSHAQNASPKNGNTSKSPLIKMLTFFIGYDKLIYVPIVFREHPTWQRFYRDILLNGSCLHAEAKDFFVGILTLY